MYDALLEVARGYGRDCKEEYWSTYRSFPVFFDEESTEAVEVFLPALQQYDATGESIAPEWQSRAALSGC
jgi:hypothetical protein